MPDSAATAAPYMGAETLVAAIMQHRSRQGSARRPNLTSRPSPWRTRSKSEITAFEDWLRDAQAGKSRHVSRH